MRITEHIRRSNTPQVVTKERTIWSSSAPPHRPTPPRPAPPRCSIPRPPPLPRTQSSQPTRPARAPPGATRNQTNKQNSRFHAEAENAENQSHAIEPYTTVRTDHRARKRPQRTAAQAPTRKLRGDDLSSCAHARPSDTLRHKEKRNQRQNVITNRTRWFYAVPRGTRERREPNARDRTK